MPTPILKIITEYCEPLIDDIRLTEKKAADAPSASPSLHLQPTDIRRKRS